MTGWSDHVDDPFRTDPGFWRAVVLNVAALVSILVVAVVNAVVDTTWVRFLVVVPIALLVAAATVGHAATQRTRPSFAGPDEWRAAERRAVAAALRGAVSRRR